MKLAFATIFILCSQHAAFGQDTVVTYLDKAWKETEKDNAAYYRKTVKHQELYDVRDYFISGILQMSGTYADKELTLKNGRFIYYDKAGIKLTEVLYQNNEKEGHALKYYPNGTIADEEWFEAGKQEKTGTYYYENGNVASIEQYATGVMSSYQYFNEDGIKDTVSVFCDGWAQFPTGQEGMKLFLSQQLIFPIIAIEEELEGKCFIRFLVSKTGEISEVTVTRKVPGCPECDREAMRVIRLMPNFKPSIDHHRIVASYFNIPITFKLTGYVKKKKKD